MPWVRLDDSMPDDPRYIDLSDAALALHVRGLCYANRHLTDGAIPAGALARLGTPEAARELEQSKPHPRWVRTETGWQIQDFHETQPTREKVLDGRKKTNDRVAKWRENNKKRKKSRSRKAADSVTPLLSEEAQTRNAVTRASGNDVGNAVANAVGNAAPDPTRPGTDQEPEHTLTPLPRRTTPVEALPEPSFLVAMAIAHAVMDDHPTGSEADWRVAFKARCLEQGWNYAARHAAHEAPVIDRALSAAAHARKARTAAKAEPRLVGEPRAAIGGRR